MTKLKNVIAFIGIVWVSIATASAQKVTMYSTTAAERWAEKEYSLDKMSDAKENITVYADSLRQNIEGFGGTFNELGWDALQYVSPAEQNKVMASLFDADGIRFAIGRSL